MEYIYAALLLHNAGKDITEESVSAVLSAAGTEVNESRAKALVAALEDVDIEEAMATAAFAPAAAVVAAPVAETAAEEVPAEENKAEEEESGMAGLGALFG
ncbi:50S ribosomal protein P1 [Methanococcoides burtonii]|uniref:Large ribosomal subunit protein P1 n=2 Tax=Methanococcoides burtonii TaxID=29291 RepID=Q12UP7_METBU|nr:50S ribosomal protein P1 [Methanococcoides burtonii]AAF89101.1 ribosomal protein L12 [Methanococcoides burtonii]ABE52829.1 LSU ribosomal protein L12P [Methanococcoides burtonii DSM 6242]